LILSIDNVRRTSATQNLDRRRLLMKLRFSDVVVLSMVATFMVWPVGATAQTSTAAPNAPAQNIAPQNAQGGSQVSSPGLTVPATVTTSQTTSGLTPGANGISPSTTGTFFSSVGRGLPGMPGGPRLGAPGGAFDPSSSYMAPTVLGPLFCDPALNVPC
jgi:hypothetical protein